MELEVLIEPVAGNGYRAVNGALPLAAEGATAEEAVENFQRLLAARVAAGARVVTLQIPGDDPWEKLAGIYKDDPYYDEWRQAMEDYRRQVENDPD
jgi:hypothetical protein